MSSTEDWDNALIEADDPNALAPEGFDDDAAEARVRALHRHLTHSLADLQVQTSSSALFQDGTGLASSRIMGKNANPRHLEGTLAFVVLSHFGDLVTIDECSDPKLLTRLIGTLSAFGLKYVDHGYVAGKVYDGKCCRLTGLSWANRYFALVPEYNEQGSGFDS